MLLFERVLGAPNTSRMYRFLYANKESHNRVTAVSQRNYEKQKIWPGKGRSTTVSPGGVPDGLTQTVVVNSIPLRPLKHEEKDTDRKGAKRDRERERATEQLGKINSLRLWVWQWCATVQQQPWQYLFRNLPHFLLQAVMHGALTSHTLAFCCDLMCITRFLRCSPQIQSSDPSSPRHRLLIGVYRAPLIIQLVALLKESRLLAHSLVQMTAPTHNHFHRKA